MHRVNTFNYPTLEDAAERKGCLLEHPAAVTTPQTTERCPTCQCVINPKGAR